MPRVTTSHTPAPFAVQPCRRADVDLVLTDGGPGGSHPCTGRPDYGRGGWVSGAHRVRRLCAGGVRGGELPFSGSALAWDCLRLDGIFPPRLDELPQDVGVALCLFYLQGQVRRRQRLIEQPLRPNDPVLQCTDS